VRQADARALDAEAASLELRFDKEQAALKARRLEERLLLLIDRKDSGAPEGVCCLLGIPLGLWVKGLRLPAASVESSRAWPPLRPERTGSLTPAHTSRSAALCVARHKLILPMGVRCVQGAGAAGGRAAPTTKRVTELEDVVEAMRRVVEKLKGENDALRRGATTNTKYMAAVTKVKELKATVEALQVRDAAWAGCRCVGWVGWVT
jgi:hypothetical protein